MKTKPLKFILLLTFLFSFSLPIFANAEVVATEGKELITGAFGFKFGEPVDESNIIRKSKYKNWEHLIVKPIKPHPLFDHYKLTIDFETKGLISIEATKKCEPKKMQCGTKSCFEDKRFLEEVIRKKYLGTFSSELPNMPYVSELRNWPRWIRVDCFQYSGSTLFRLGTQYIDHALDKTAAQRGRLKEFLERKEELGDDGL